MVFILVGGPYGMTLERKLKSALNDNRLLILGAQVLFGFQFNGIFQDMFQQLPVLSRGIVCSGLALLMLTVGLLIAPSMQHRLVERGDDSQRILVLATIFGAWALLPLAIALALDLFVAVGHVVGPPWGRVAGTAFFLLTALCWYVLEFAMLRKKQPLTQAPAKPTPLEDKVEQLLTEARVIIPGAQALFGFQLSITLMSAFQRLPAESKIAHVVALCCVGLAIVLLMAPASLHRISFRGEDDPAFLKIGSTFVVTAPAPLALGIAFDTYVAAGRAIHVSAVPTLLAIVAILALLGLWYAFPLWSRRARRSART